MSRRSPALAWTGDRLFVFGGEWPESGGFLTNDAALINPRTGKVEKIDPGPFKPKLWFPKAVAVGSQVIVVGTSCRTIDLGEEGYNCDDPTHFTSAVYNVEDHEWNKFDFPPESRRIRQGEAHAMGSTSDGRAIFRLSEFLGAAGERSQFWSFSAEDEKWERLPDAPFEPGDSFGHGTCLQGDQLFVSGIREPPGGGTFAPISLARLELQGDSKWRFKKLPDVEYAPERPGDVFADIQCSDKKVMLRVVVDSRQIDPLWVYDSKSGEWTTAAIAPGHAEAPFYDDFSTKSELIFPSSGFAYDADSDSWRDVGELPPISRGGVPAGRGIAGYVDGDFGTRGSDVYYFVPQ